MKPIQTQYNGTNFRSLLEARWAAWFDLVGWKWDYEPFELCGWIPDFVLSGPAARLLVEVKLLLVTDIIHTQEVQRELDCSYRPNESSHEILLLGAGIQDYDGTAVLGWVREKEYGWDVAALCDARLCRDCPGTSWSRGYETPGGDELLADLCAYSGSYERRLQGFHPGGAGGLWSTEAGKHIGLWREAGNRTQWRR
jgi:hypothetical protein